MQSFVSQIVLVDANVWFSRTLRDWIGMLYTTPDSAPFEVKWTEDILAELLRALRRKNPEWDGGEISRIRDLIAGTFEVGRVDDYLVAGDYLGNDPNDAHVHAAAIACGADILLTQNVKDFARRENESSYEVLTPDEFFLLIDDSRPELVSKVTVSICEYWMNRKIEAELPKSLKEAGCPRFAERVRVHLFENQDKITG